MKLKAFIVALVAGALLILSATNASARCVTPCLPGFDCIQQCRDLPELS